MSKIGQYVLELEERTADLPKHTYYLNENEKLVGFRREGEIEVKWFTKPMSFDKRYRKFKKTEKSC